MNFQGSICTSSLIPLVATGKVCWTAGWCCGHEEINGPCTWTGWSHTLLSCYPETGLKTQVNKHPGRAVRKVAATAPWKGPTEAIHLLPVSQDTEFSLPGIQLLRHFIRHESEFSVSDSLWLQTLPAPCPPCPASCPQYLRNNFPLPDHSLPSCGIWVICSLKRLSALSSISNMNQGTANRKKITTF